MPITSLVGVADGLRPSLGRPYGLRTFIKVLPLVVLAVLAWVNPAKAMPCQSRTVLPPTVNFRVDNDLMGNQDQGYSNGVQLTLVSPNLIDYTDDPCLPRLARLINRHLTKLAPAEFDQQNMVVTFSHALFTPTDFNRTDLIREDRPYAAAVLIGLGYNTRIKDTLRTTHLQFGLVGPSARGKEVQNEIHRIIGDEPFRGWQHQLRDEPVFRIVHERMQRYAPEQGVWGWDAITHYGGSLGNLTTYANAGAEVRVGRHLPDDFGSTPLRPAGENTAPSRRRPWGSLLGMHLFLTVGARWVLRDITLDGNTFKNSHSVDKRAFVGETGIGLAVTKGQWKFALARYEVTREFEGQKDTPKFGSFTISRAL